MNHFLKKFRQDVIAIGFLGLGLFLSLALISYTPRDPSLNSIGQGLKVMNYCGIVGSFMADMFYQFLGLAAWVLVASLLKMAYASFKGESMNLKNIRFVWALLLIVNVAALLSIYLPTTKIYQNQIYLGGLLGLGVSQALMRAFASVGVQVILWSLMAILVVFYSEKTLQELTAVPRDFIATARKKKYFSKLMAFFAGLFAAEKTGKTKTVAKKEEKPKDLSKAQQLIFPKLAEKFEEAQEDAPLENEVAEEEAFDGDDGDEETPAVRLAQKRKVVMRAKPPRRIENWEMPKLSLLEDPPASRIKIDKAEIQRKAESLVEKLKNFSIEGSIQDAKPGPLVTMYEFKPNADVKISKISELEDDLSLALSSESVRVVGHIPGTDVVGIETANLRRETVYYKDLIAEDMFWSDDLA
ncbi:MAG TPA: DNA translocase FtsK 4TM domain-containing protein, partial [Bdellovibrio sp.]|nr:DNA translocase FtsK 4TM domain-containing protein [Bdellovibrio sp.]